MTTKLIAVTFILACVVGDKEFKEGDKGSFDRATVDKLLADKYVTEDPVDPPADKKAAAKDEAKTVKVRMLVDTPHEGEVLKCDSVQTLPIGLAKELVHGGKADDNSAAVKYAEQLAREAEAAKPKAKK